MGSPEPGPTRLAGQRNAHCRRPGPRRAAFFPEGCPHQPLSVRPRGWHPSTRVDFGTACFLQGVLLGLFSWVTVVAHVLLRGQLLVPRRAAWPLCVSPSGPEDPLLHGPNRPPRYAKPPPLDPARLREFLCYTG